MHQQLMSVSDELVHSCSVRNKRSEISVKTKISVLMSCVFSYLLYAAEQWTLKAMV